MGHVMPSCVFLLDFLEKKEDTSKKERGEEEGKDGKVMPVLLQGTLWGKPSRKGQGEARYKGVMPSGAILLDFLENKEDNMVKVKRRRGREGRQ